MAQSVQQSVRNQKGQLRFCYEKSLRDNPSLEGTLLVGFDVSEGAALNVAVLRNSTGDLDLAECFSQHIQGWRFSLDVELAVEFPFHLEASRNL